MDEIRIHGRGGQGVVLASRILALAASYEDKFAQSYPYFGSERRGSPVVAYVRMDTEPIRLRTNIKDPNCVLVLDPNLLTAVNVTQGLREGGFLVINGVAQLLPDARVRETYRVSAIDATGIALKTIGIPITNTAMLGAFSAATRMVQIDSVCEAIRHRFGDDLGAKNVAAANAGFNNSRELR